MITTNLLESRNRDHIPLTFNYQVGGKIICTVGRNRRKDQNKLSGLKRASVHSLKREFEKMNKYYDMHIFPIF